MDSHEERLPPGQYIPRGWPVLHYGPVPKFRQKTWDFRVFGATELGEEHRWSWAEFERLPTVEVIADFHCVTKFTVPGNRWRGVPAAAFLELAPPDPDATHVMIWAEYGYSANIRISDFMADTTLFVTHRNGERLSPDHGFPVRLVVPHLYAWKSVKWTRAAEYLVKDRRGFWEERGYHAVADPWHEQRYSYQEDELEHDREHPRQPERDHLGEHGRDTGSNTGSNTGPQRAPQRGAHADGKATARSASHVSNHV